MEHRTSVLDNSLIWLGAGISLAEIQTGTYFAPLGFERGLLAILIGHLIGCTLMFCVGLIGACQRQGAMETVKGSFGQHGAILFAVLNVCQLVGWTGIMIYDGAIAAQEAFRTGRWIWCLLIGALIVVWLLVGIQRLGKLNTVAVTLLLLLTVWLCWNIFSHQASAAQAGTTLSFGAAVELGVSMPLSWLPLISDYTSTARRPFSATLASVVFYGLISCWMYLMGMGAGLLTGQSNIAKVMAQSGMGLAGLLVIIFSTVTTTFMDAYSAGASSESIWSKLKATPVAIVVTIIGVAGAMLFPMDNITSFLYLIGSVFAPMSAIMIADYFWFGHSAFQRHYDGANLIIWLGGFLCYRWLMTTDTVLGNTLPDIIIVLALCVIWHWVSSRHLQEN